MLRLYHFGGAICAQKVRLALAEKGLTWESSLVSPGAANGGMRSAEYLRLNPGGVVPTLVHDDLILVESRIISEYVEDAFDGPRLMPSSASERHRARLWSKQIDDSLHLYIFVLSFVAGMRETFLALPPEEREQRLPGLRDGVKRAITLDLMEHDCESRYVSLAARRFRRLIVEMDACLAADPWLAGTDYSLADADYTAYAHRLQQLGMSSLWADQPHFTDWWERVRGRPSFSAAISRWLAPGEAEAKRLAAGAFSAKLRIANLV